MLIEERSGLLLAPAVPSLGEPRVRPRYSCMVGIWRAWNARAPFRGK